MSNQKYILSLAEAIAPYRKRTERFVGYVPYTFSFEKRRYNGTSQKPEKISLLGKTLVQLISVGVSLESSLASYTGLDIEDKIEKGILRDALQSITSKVALCAKVGNAYQLTPLGRQYLETGECVKTFTKQFDVYVSLQYPQFADLHKLADDNPAIQYEPSGIKNDKLSLEKLKNICESQASHMQCHTRGLELLSASLMSFNTVHIEVVVCFLQSMRDNSIRTLVFDPGKGVVCIEISSIFNEDLKLRDTLLKQCLKEEVLKNEAVQVESGEKTEEQIEYETKTIEAEDSAADSEETGYAPTREVGSIFDSAEFEKELSDIFERHNNEEIWLISPWIRNYAFLKIREPMIRKFLNKGGAVYIAYSEPEKLGEEMVQRDSMSVVEELDANYDKFFYTELPKFHYKNVIEYKKKHTSLYTGSFNILSFSITGVDEHYRMEQMSIANAKVAKETREKYLKAFAQCYFDRAEAELNEAAKGSTLYIGKAKHLQTLSPDDDRYSSILTKATECGIALVDKREINIDKLKKISNRIIMSTFRDDETYVQAQLAAFLYAYKVAMLDNDVKRINMLDGLFSKFLEREQIYKYCRLSLRKSKNNERKSIVNLVCDGFNYEISDVSIQPKTFKLLNGIKEYIDFAGERIQGAKFNIEKILQSAAASIGIQ